MGITLTSKSIASTYDGLLKLSDNDPLSGAFKVVTDGFGNESGIQLNNSGDVNIAGILNVGTRVNTPILQLTGGTGDQGTFSWNSDEWTVDLIQNGTTLQLGQEVQIHVKNQSGATIPDGAPVYATGTLGASGRITVAPMIADGSIPAKYFLGVATETIANGADGKITTFGKIRGIDTSAYAEGQTLWVSATSAGNFQTTRPVAPNLDLEVAIVINSSVNNGTIFVRSNNGHYLGTAHDVNITSVAENDLLVYKTNRWVNTKSIGDLSAANVTLSGYLRGPATFVIDPAAYGDETGLVQILGDLRVDGTTTTINSTTISVSDKNITLAKDAATAGDANGAGITIAGANATLTYLSATDDFTFNKNVNASRFVGPLTGDVTGNADTANALSTARNIALTGSITGNADFDGSGDIIITTTTNHNHDDIYYTETEVGNFFSGSTVIAGYNKTNWDTAYNYKINSGYFNSNTGDLVLTRQDDSTLEINFDDRYVIANTQKFNTNTYGVDSGAGTQRYKLLTTSGQTDQFFHITINRAYDYGDNDQTKQQIIYQRRLTNKNLRWRLDGDLTATQQVFIEIYAKANGDDEVWLVCTDYARPQVYVEHDGFFWNGLTNADTPTGTLIKTTELTASNKPNWDEQVGLVKTTELYSDTTYLRGSAFVLAPNGSSYDTLVYRDGTNPHVLYAGGGTSTQWNTAYNYSQVGHLPLAGGDVTGTVTIGGKLGVGVTPSDWSLSGLSAMQIENAGFYGYSTNEYGLTGNLYYNGGWKYIANGTAQLYIGVNGAHIWYTYASGTAGAAATQVQTMQLNTAGNLTITGTLSASGYNKSNWDAAYSWGDHDGLYLPIGGKAADSQLLDGLDSSLFIYGNNASGTNDNNVNDWNAPTKTGFYSHSNAANKWAAATSWSSILHFRLYANDNNYASQLGFNTYDNRVFARTNSGGTWTAWDEFITSANIGSQSVSFATNAGTLDSLDSTQFLRSDEPDVMTGDGAANTYRGVLRINNTGGAKWGGVSFPDDVNAADSAKNNYYLIGRGESISDRVMSFHIPTGGNYESGIQPRFVFASTGADQLMTIQATTGNVFVKGYLGVGVTNAYGQISIKNQIYVGSSAPISSYAATSGVEGQNFFNGYYAVDSDGLGPYPRYFDIVSTGSPDGSNGGSNIRFFTNPIALNSPAVERMRITSRGYVGIGTTSPETKLHVEGGDIFVTDNGGNPRLVLGDSTSGGNWGSIQWDSAGDFIKIGTSLGSSTLVVNEANNVGINTTSPGQKLHVDGNVLFNGGTGASTFNDVNIGGISGWSGNEAHRINFVYGSASSPSIFQTIESHFDGNTSRLRFRNLFNSGAQSTAIAMTIMGNGSVGIGVDTPTYPLDLGNGGTGNSIRARRIYANGTGTDSGFTLDSTLIYQDASGRFLITNPGSYPSTAFCINTSGNVGINTTNPSGKFDIAYDMYSGAATGVLQAGAYGNINFKTGSSTGAFTNQQGITWQVDNYGGTTNYGVQAQIAVGNDGNVGTFMGFFTSNNYGAPPVERIRIQHDGRVGIGTTSPAAKLHVVGDGTNAGGIILRQGSNQLHYIYTSSQFQLNRIGSSAATWRWGQEGGSDFMTLTSTGLGIGTTSPSDLLHIKSTTNDARMILDGATGFDAELKFFENGNAKYTVGYDAATANFVVGTTNVDTQQRLVINSAGDVGIGTTSPNAPLDVTSKTSGSSNVQQWSYNGAASSYRLQLNTIVTPGLVRWSFDMLNAGAGYNNVLVLDRGNVGIGTAAPAYKLDVAAGTIKATNDILIGDAAYSTNASYVGMKTTFQTGTSDYMILSGTTDGATYVSAKDGEGVYIRGGGNNSGNQIYVPDSTYIQVTTNSFNVSGDVLAYATSDARLKDNVTPIQNPIQKVKAIGGYEFDWNDKQDTYEGHDVGVLAQEIEAIMPEVVTTRENGYKAVKYEKIVPLLIEAIKEQQKQIDELKSFLDGSTK